MYPGIIWETLVHVRIFSGSMLNKLKTVTELHHITPQNSTTTNMCSITSGKNTVKSMYTPVKINLHWYKFLLTNIDHLCTAYASFSLTRWQHNTPV